MAGYLAAKVVLVVGNGTPEHRAVAVALAEAGADVVVAGPPGQPAEVQMNSIANEVWAIGRRSAVVAYEQADAAAFAEALARAQSEMGRLDLVVTCQPVLNA